MQFYQFYFFLSSVMLGPAGGNYHYLTIFSGMVWQIHEQFGKLL